MTVLIVTAALTACAVAYIAVVAALRKWVAFLDGRSALEAFRPEARDIGRAERKLPNLKDTYFPKDAA